MIAKMKEAQKMFNWAKMKQVTALLLHLIILLSMFNVLSVNAQPLASDSHLSAESEIVIEWQCDEADPEEEAAPEDDFVCDKDENPSPEEDEPAEPEEPQTSYGVTLLRDDFGYEVYDAGTTAHFKIHVEVSGLDMSDILINPVLTLCYDTSDIVGAAQKPTITIQDMLLTLLKSPKVTNAAASTITWNLNDLMGGTEFLLLGQISMPNNSTPMGYPLTLKAVLTSDSHPPVESEIVIEWKYDKKVPTKTVAKGDYINELGHINGVNDYLVFAGYDADMDGFIDADKTYPVTYTFTNGFIPNSPDRSIEYITIADHLPEGAVFDPLDNDKRWVYDEETHTATYTGPDDTVKLYLRFPDGEVGKNYLNTADYTYHIRNIQFDDPMPEDYTYEIKTYVQLDDHEVEGSIYNKYPVKTRRGDSLTSASYHANRLAYDEEISGEYWYYSIFHNSMKMTPMTGVMISDDGLNENLKFAKFNVSATPGAIMDTATVQYREAGQAEWTDFVALTAADLTISIRPDTEYYYGSRHASCKYTDTFTLPGGIVIDGLRLLVSKLRPDGVVYLDAGAELRQPELYTGDNRPSSAVIFENTSNFYLDDSMTGKQKRLGAATAYQDIVPYAPKFRGMKTLAGLAVPTTAQVYVGNILTVSNRLRFYDFEKEDSILFEGGQIIDLLPQGYAYVPDSMAFTNLNGQTLRDHYDNIEPIIVYDYQGTGMTALIWNLKEERDITWFKGEYWAYYSYKIEVLETVPPGISTLIGYFHWPEFSKIKANTNNQSASSVYKGYVPFTDTTDINGNGRTDETFLRCDIPLNYVSPTAMVASKGVKGSCNSSYLYAPALGYSQVGKPSSYRLSVKNYTLEDLYTLTLFDVLPYVGDKGLVANAGGAYVGRGSEFGVRLTGPVEVDDPLDRFEAYYSLKDPEPWDGIAGYETKVGGAWLTAAQVEKKVKKKKAAWSDVRVFKVVLKDGEKLETNKGVDVIVPVVMPESGELGSKAYNSFAIDTGTARLEAVKVGIEIVDYDVAIEKAADGYLYYEGDTVTYDLKVTNTQKIGVTDTYVIDTIPEGLTFVSCNRAHSYDDEARKLRIDLGSLAALQSTAIKVTCTADALGVFTNIATVTVNQDEFTYENNTDDCEIKVVRRGSLTIKKLLDGRPEAWGADESTEFTATVKDAATGRYLNFSGIAPNYVFIGTSPEKDFITISADVPATITGLPVGMVCVVEEAEDVHYTASYIGNAATVADGDNCVIKVKNTFGGPSLPMVGGMGAKPFITTGLTGMLLTLTALNGVFQYNRRKRRRWSIE